jgi:hypothetical protein
MSNIIRIIMALSTKLVSLLFSLLASLCTATGFIAMKIGNIKVEDDSKKKFYRQREWLFGLLLVGIGQLSNGGK